MAKDPTGVFVPKEDADTQHDHPAGDKDKKKGKDGKLSFSEVTGEMDAKEASFVEAMELDQSQLAKLRQSEDARGGDR